MFFKLQIGFSTQEGIPFVLDPDSKLWNRYYRNNVGRVPLDLGAISLDCDMVTSFKAISAWQEAMSRR